MALQKRLAQVGTFCDRVKYKQRYGYFESKDGIVKYPYFFEVFIGHCSNIPVNLKVVQSINSKVSNNSLVFGGPYKYNFTEKGYRTATSIFDIFEHYK